MNLIAAVVANHRPLESDVNMRFPEIPRQRQQRPGAGKSHFERSTWRRLQTLGRWHLPSPLGSGGPGACKAANPYPPFSRTCRTGEPLAALLLIVTDDCPLLW
jgi:hypothetical protein